MSVPSDDGGAVEVIECRAFSGDDSVLKVTDAIKKLARRYDVQEVAFDSWRFKSQALRLENECGLLMVDVPQTPSRLVQMSENLHRVIIERNLRHPGFRDLDRAVASAIAIPGPRGWRLAKASHESLIDPLISLCMAADRATAKTPRCASGLDLSVA